MPISAKTEYFIFILLGKKLISQTETYSVRKEIMEDVKILLERYREQIEELKDVPADRAALKLQSLQPEHRLFILEQIEGRQKAGIRLPHWTQTDGICFPPQISMQQCSSEQTAAIKQDIAKEMLPHCGSMIDMTGGFGVDFTCLAQLFKKSTYVERNAHLAAVAQHNASVLGVSNADYIIGDGIEYLSGNNEKYDLIFIDPARRDSAGRRVSSIDEYSPDLTKHTTLLLEHLTENGIVMAKLSPMLDISRTIEQLNNVCKVIITAVQNECKELLFILKKAETDTLGNNTPIECRTINIAKERTYTEMFTLPQDIQAFSATHSPLRMPQDFERKYLFEPDAAVMKSGCFGALAARYGITPVSSNSHLFTGIARNADFPGRVFLIEHCFPYNKKYFSNIYNCTNGAASITCRNFALNPDELRRQLKLHDGSDFYIFATRNADGKGIVFVCRKK